MGRNPLKLQVHAANGQRWLAQAGGDSIPGSGTAQRQQGGICSGIISCQSARDRHDFPTVHLLQLLCLGAHMRNLTYCEVNLASCGM